MEGTVNRRTGIATISDKGDDIHGWLKCIEWKMRETKGLWEAVQTAPKRGLLPVELKEDEGEKDVKPKLQPENANAELQAQAMSVIIAHTGGMIRQEIMRFNSPFEVWAHIQALNTDTTGIETCLALKKLINIKETGDLDDYLRRFIQCRSRCIELQWNLDDKFYGVLLVTNLSEEYNPIRSLLLGKGKNLTFIEARDSLYAEVASNRSRDVEDEARKTAETVIGVQPSAQCYNCLGTDHRSRNCPKPKVKCSFPACGKMGHQESVCFAKHGYPNANNSNDSANVSQYINQQYDGLDICFVSDMSCAYLTQLASSNTTCADFVGDNAATSHMTFQKHLFRPEDLTAVSGRYVKVGNGQLVPVKAIGNLTMTGTNGRRYSMEDVLYAPDLDCNLFSIKKCHSSRFSITFPSEDPTRLFIKDAQGQPVLTGKLRKKLYFMEMLPFKRGKSKSKRTYKGKQAMPTADSLNPDNVFISEEVWHQRLGHASFERMKQIENWEEKFKIPQNRPFGKPCMGCSKGKFTRRRKKTFRIHKAKEILEVTHTDIIGPFKTGMNGYRFMITFVDEASRHGTVHFLKRKSAAAKYFSHSRE